MIEVNKIMLHYVHELQQLQSLPLEMKIIKSKQRIKEWFDYYDGNAYLSFSGGKDSTVLKHLIDTTIGVYDVPSVFVDTGLEYPEVRKFVKKFNNITVIRPKMSFFEVVKKYGYPVISKNVSLRLQYAKKAVAEGREENHGYYKMLCGLTKDKNGKRSQFNCSKWKFLLDAPFNCSAECCNVMKKIPAKKYTKETGRMPFIATLAEESHMRRQQWLSYGCNAYNLKTPHSQPLAFWTEQDILQYIVEKKLPYVSVYGEILKDNNGKYYTTGVERTGCIFCMFGCHKEKEVNRFQLLKKSHPKIYEYCINGGEEINGVWQPNKNGLGLGRVLNYINIDYSENKNEEE